MMKTITYAIKDTIHNQWIRPAERYKSRSKFTSDLREAKFYKSFNIATSQLESYSRSYSERNLKITVIELNEKD